MITTPVKLWRRSKKVASLLGKEGKILHFTNIRVPSREFVKQAPYPVVIVQLGSGERMIGQLVDWRKEDLVSGKKVIAILRRITTDDAEGIISYGVKFKPL